MEKELMLIGKESNHKLCIIKGKNIGKPNLDLAKKL